MTDDEVERLREIARKALREADLMADNARAARKKADAAEMAYLAALLKRQGQLTIFEEE